MKSFTIVAAALAAVANANPLAPRSVACKQDNCFRALTVTDSYLKTARPFLAMADCSALVAHTSTITTSVPISTAYATVSTIISTTTTTVTTGTETSTIVIPTTIVVSHIAKRDLAAVPTYATKYCTNVAGLPDLSRFASACSCYGAFIPTTATAYTTIAPVTTTLTEYSTSYYSSTESDATTTTTTTSTVNPVQTNYVNLPFNIVDGSGNILNSGPRAVPYAHINIPFFGSGSAAVFTHDPSTGLLTSNSLNAVASSGEAFFEFNSHVSTGSLSFTIAGDKSITTTGGDLQSCTYNDGTGLVGFVTVGDSTATGCIPVTLYAQAIPATIPTTN